MKKLFRKDWPWFVAIALMGVVLAFAGHFSRAKGDPWDYKAAIASDEDTAGICPRTRIKGKVSDCLTCHIAGNSFAVRESDPDDLYKYPNYNTKLVQNGDELLGYYLLTDIDSDDVAAFFRYIDQHKVNHVIIEVHSPGGSLLDAWRIAGMMTSWQHQEKNRIVETRVYGFAASAGFLVAISGGIGHRYVSKSAEMMFHELWTFKMFSIQTPSSSEDESKVLRHLQDTADSWIARRSKLTKEQIDEKVKNKQFWCNGIDAVKTFGFADHLLN